jgi:hypothetical protein
MPKLSELIMIEMTSQEPTLPPNEVLGVLGVRVYGGEGYSECPVIKELIVCSFGHRNSETIQYNINISKGEQGYGGISGKMQKMGELLRVKYTINDIIPETDGISLIRVTNGNTPVLSMKPKDVLPPEGAFFPCQMRNSIAVVFLPDECNHWIFFLRQNLSSCLRRRASF